MEIIKQHGHQGDSQFFELKEIPSNAKKVEKQYIAVSERSGSFHALCGNYDMYDIDNGFVLDVKDECVLNHSLESVLKASGISLSDSKVLPKKDHRHSVIPKGIYAVGIQNRFDPLENIKKITLD